MKNLLFVTVGAAALIAIGCGPKKTRTNTAGSNAGSTATPGASPASSPSTAPVAKKAGGKIESKSGSKVTGDVELAQGTDGKVTVTVHVENATPGDHGVHLHEKGDCSAADASSAGGHFNPAGDQHGSPTGVHHHAGDFGNVKVGADGKGTLSLTVTGLTIDNGPTGVLGKSLVVHEKADDMATQPSGNSGARQGCAVIAAQ